MLTRDYPGSEIAVGSQLQHAATRARLLTPAIYPMG